MIAEIDSAIMAIGGEIRVGSYLGQQCGPALVLGFQVGAVNRLLGSQLGVIFQCQFIDVLQRVRAGYDASQRQATAEQPCRHMLHWHNWYVCLQVFHIGDIWQ